MQCAALMKILRAKQFHPPPGAQDCCSKMAHGECELCAPQLRATAIRCRAQTAQCGTMWGGPPMSVPPPFSLAAAGRDTMLEHGNGAPAISRGAGP